MDAFDIQGPCTLQGEISISGSKNAALPILFASLMCPDAVEIHNVPDVKDIHTTRDLFAHLGVSAHFSDHVFTLTPKQLSCMQAPYEHVKKMRASILCLGPLLARYGEAEVSFPGGCVIGTRPIDWHLAGLRKLGAEISVKDGYVVAKARKLVGAVYRFPKKSVTGTANLVCAAVLAQGVTVIENAAREPEVEDVCRFLGSMGARIEGAGTATIRVRGVPKLRGGSYSVMGDRIEWGTYAIAAAATQGRVVLHGEVAQTGFLVLRKLQEAGIDAAYDHRRYVTRIAPRKLLRPVSITTQAYPGFPTDLQAQWMALMTQGSGSARISERIFENRFMHVGELQRLGSHIEIESPHMAIVHGTPGKLTGAEVMVSDIRAGAALVIAALVSQGTTRIRRVYHLDRGYECMEQKLTALGVPMARISASS